MLFELTSRVARYKLRAFSAVQPDNVDLSSLGGAVSLIGEFRRSVQPGALYEDDSASFCFDG
jgi:hypothetical protein